MQSQIHMTFGMKNMWIPPRIFFFFSLYSFFTWLMSMKTQMEEGINRHRPLTPTTHFLVSIEYQYCSNPKENASQMRPIERLQDINAVANTASGIRCVKPRLYEWRREIWSNWRGLGLMDGKRIRWMAEKAGNRLTLRRCINSMVETAERTGGI